MNISSNTTDNITEVLEKIIEFTDRRDKVLTRNIEEFENEGFVPEDLDVTGFADLMTVAVAEHVTNDRLLLRDNDNIRFGKSGTFETVAVVDTKAAKLLDGDMDQYIEMQINKLSENLVNKRMAMELLEQKQEYTVNMID